MSLLNDNLSYIRKIDTELYDRITGQIEKRGNPEYEISVCAARNGEANISIIHAGNRFFVHSNYNPQVEAERWVRSVNREAGLIIVFGLGMGYHVQALLKQVDKKTRICVIEPSARIFKALISSRKLSELFDERVVLFVSDDADYLSTQLFNVFRSSLMEKVEFAEYPAYSRFYGEFCKSIQQKFTEIIRILLVNISTIEHFKHLWILNNFINLIHINGAGNCKSLEGRFKNIPCVIVSAGPSLDKNVKLLNSIKNKALILAGGSAIGILNRNRIKPHFMVAMDGAPEEKDIFEGVDFSEISMIYLNRLYYQIVEVYKEKKFMLLDNDDVLSKLFCREFSLDYSEVSPEQTVAGINLAIAVMLGCNPIVFVGQDLAYTNLEMHAAGAAHMKSFEDELASNPKKFIMIKDIYGNDTYTIRQFLATRASMGNKIKKYIDEGFSFINATEGGIGIDNCDNMDLKDVIEIYLTNMYNIPEIIEESYQSGVFNIDINKIEQYFEYIYKNICSIRDRAEELHLKTGKAEEVLEAKNFVAKKYRPLAESINELQGSMENDRFYRDFIMGCIEQTVNIHKVIMGSKLDKAENLIQIDLEKVRAIKNQSIEIIAICDFIKDLKENAVNFYLNKLKGM